MTDILEHVRYLRQIDLGAEEIVMIALEFLVREVVPCAGIPIEQRRRFGNLSPVLAALTLERVVGIANCVFVEGEELP